MIDVLEIIDNTIDMWKPIRDQHEYPEESVRAHHYIEAWQAIRETCIGLSELKEVRVSAD